MIENIPKSTISEIIELDKSLSELESLIRKRNHLISNIVGVIFPYKKIESDDLKYVFEVLDKGFGFIYADFKISNDFISGVLHTKHKTIAESIKPDIFSLYRELYIGGEKEQFYDLICSIFNTSDKNNKKTKTFYYFLLEDENKNLYQAIFNSYIY